MAAKRKSNVIARAVQDGDGKKVALGAAVAGGAMAAAKLGWDRITSDDPRRFRLRPERACAGGTPAHRGRPDRPVDRGPGGRGRRGRPTAVHEARKSLKRLRAVVRLARDELGDYVYRRDNRAFRDAGRRLSGARDSRVLLDTLEDVSERHPDKAPREALLPFRRTLLSQHANAQRRLQADDAAAEVLRELREVRARVPYWPLERESIESLAPGFERIYRRGRKAYRRALKEPSTENLHELRKRSKDLWYAGQVVRPASPKRLKAISKDAKELSELIGEEHDLALLADSAEARPDRFGDEAEPGRPPEGDQGPPQAAAPQGAEARRAPLQAEAQGGGAPARGPRLGVLSDSRGHLRLRRRADRGARARRRALAPRGGGGARGADRGDERRGERAGGPAAGRGACRGRGGGRRGPLRAARSTGCRCRSRRTSTSPGCPPRRGSRRARSWRPSATS